MATLLQSATFISRKLDGTPNALGKVYTYAAGGLTPLGTYTTQAAGTPNTNPVILDADGTAQIWLDPAVSYRIIEKTAADATIRDVDNITGASMAADLASVASGKGDALIGVKSTATGSVARTQHDKNAETVSVFDFMTTAQIADVQAYTYGLNVNAAVQTAMTAAYASGHDLFFPPGGYLVTGLEIPGTNNNAGKAARFRMYGAGFGEAGVIALKNKGSVLYSVTAAPIFNYTATVAGNGNGEVEIDHLALWGTSTTPVIDLDTFYGLSSIHHCNIVQSGTGNGVQIGWGATYDIHHCYIVGASYATNNLGATRTGIGLYLAQSTNSGGLQTVRQSTVGGWHTCIQVGVTGSSIYCYAPQIHKCEAAYCYYGIRLTGLCEGAVVDDCYFEGIDSGSYVLDEGNYNTVKNSFFFFSSGSLTAYTMLSSTTAAKFGSRYENNVFYLFSTVSTVGIDITSSGVDGGPGKVVSRNHFLCSAAGIAGVIGLRINGVDPRIETVSNDFQPAGAWSGSGSYAIRNLSTSSDGTTGSGVFGLSQSRSSASTRTVPHLGRGSVSLAVEPVALNNTNVTAGVLAVGELSVFTFTPTGNVSITQIDATNLPDKTFSIHVTATAFAVTFTHGTPLKLAGSANLVTGANGCWISFQIKPGGVAWETARVVY